MNRCDIAVFCCFVLLVAALNCPLALCRDNDTSTIPTLTQIPCNEVTAVDFRNNTISLGKQTFAFKGGTAVNYDGPGISNVPDWKAEIQIDKVVKPLPSIPIRFVLIHDSHETGSDWNFYLVGYRCLNGKLQQVFYREGLSLGIDRLDKSGITVGLNPEPGKPVRKHWTYVWNQDKSQYVLSQTWMTEGYP